MSPLLTARPSVSVALRLAAACAATALAAAVVAVVGGGSHTTAAVPACLGVGIVCSALVAHMLQASARAVEDPRLAWMCAGVTVAFAGLVCSLLASAALFPGGGLVTQDPDAGGARYLVWHGALVAAGGLALLSVVRVRALLAFAVLFAALLTLTCFTGVVDLAGADGYTPLLRALVATLALAQVAVAAGWWLRARGAPNWGELCVLCMMALGTLDMVAYASATHPYSGLWWGSLALRAGQFAVPAVGLLLGFIALADKLRSFQEEMAQGFVEERERAREQQEIVSFDAARRERVRARMRRLIGGDGLQVAFQPIVDLSGGQVVGAEALARFTDADGEKIPTERCFLDAHAVDLGIELELAVITHALACHQRLPGGRYLALNVSPALLEHEGLNIAIAAAPVERPIVVELTEHQPVEDYVALLGALDRLREQGVRVAVDDVGSGFASFRHVTRVNPDILKLDRTLVCGIDDDPVRQSLASAIVAFARDVGATVVSEGIETGSELTCLRDLAVGCGQGFFLARPVEAPALVA
jgi:EAL domain-containing protein (putative c-di-GMP-specific phosphodiesterase class I)